MFKYICCLSILSLFVSLGTVMAQDVDPQRAKFYDEVKKTAGDSNVYYLNKKKAHSIFHDEISSTVFLSKASFYANKRWMTKSESPQRYPNVLDARVSPYFRISTDNWNVDFYKGHLMFSLYFNPDFEVRILENQSALGDESHPVRTASFRPGGELFIRYNKENTFKNTHLAFSLKGNHHSDGQDGEEFNSVDRPWGAKGYANTYNGNFSDDFLIGLNMMLFHKSNNLKYNTFAKLGYSASTGTSEGLAKYKVYGTDRINFLSSLAYIPSYKMRINGKEFGDSFNVEMVRLEFYASYITNKMNVGPIQALQPAKFNDRFNFHLTGHLRIKGFSAAGFFLEGGYYGQDLYNIYYQQSSWFYKLGMSFGLFKYSYPSL